MRSRIDKYILVGVAVRRSLRKYALIGGSLGLAVGGALTGIAALASPAAASPAPAYSEVPLYFGAFINAGIINQQ